MGRLFGTDGIRGQANIFPMDGATAFAVGQALTHLLGSAGHDPRVIVGRDTRVSGHMLEGALQAGITSMGGDVWLSGVLPTPGVAYLTASLRADAGVVLSASHNPFQDNGIKVFTAAGYKLTDEQEEAIEELVLGGRLSSLIPCGHALGRVRHLEDAQGRYIVFLKHTFPRSMSLRGLKIVLDTANGATYRVAPAVFSELGADVIVIHDTPDGCNINKDAGSQHTEALRRTVQEAGADVGLAFDGDGDRLIAVDERGEQLTGDQTLIVCAKMLKDEDRLSNDLLVTTVMSNMGLRVAARRLGLHTHAAQVGDRHVLEDMLQMGAVLGGEDSGHVIFLEHHTTGDGIITALQLLAAMLRADRPLSQLAGLMDVFPQRLVNVEVQRKPNLEDVPEIVSAIAAVEAELRDEGRVLIRYSGTQDLCRVMVEGPTPEITERHARYLAEIVASALSGESVGSASIPADEAGATGQGSVAG